MKLENEKIKVGDLVKLRNDLINGKCYTETPYYDEMYFDGFKKVMNIGLFDSDKEIQMEIEDKMDYWYTKDMIGEVKRPCQYKTIYKCKETILNKEEKEFINDFLNFFKKDIYCVEYIKKATRSDWLFFLEYIEIGFLYIETDGKTDGLKILLPPFNTNSKFKNMELNKEYKLAELGL